jgi:hypothetical protein
MFNQALTRRLCTIHRTCRRGDFLSEVWESVELHNAVLSCRTYNLVSYRLRAIPNARAQKNRHRVAENYESEAQNELMVAAEPEAPSLHASRSKKNLLVFT